MSYVYSNVKQFSAKPFEFSQAEANAVKEAINNVEIADPFLKSAINSIDFTSNKLTKRQATAIASVAAIYGKQLESARAVTKEQKDTYYTLFNLINTFINLRLITEPACKWILALLATTGAVAVGNLAGEATELHTRKNLNKIHNSKLRDIESALVGAGTSFLVMSLLKGAFSEKNKTPLNKLDPEKIDKKEVVEAIEPVLGLEFKDIA